MDEGIFRFSGPPVWFNAKDPRLCSALVLLMLITIFL